MMGKLIMIFIIFLLVYSNIELKIYFERKENNDIIILSTSMLYGLLKYKKKIPFIDLKKMKDKKQFVQIKEEQIKGKEPKEERKNIGFEDVKEVVDYYEMIAKKYRNTIQYIKSKIIIKNIEWDTEIGLEDAADTAIVTGILWMLKSNIILFIKNYFHVTGIYVNVHPNYQLNEINTVLNCIITIKVGYIIIAGIKFILASMRDGEKNEWTSN